MSSRPLLGADWKRAVAGPGLHRQQRGERRNQGGSIGSHPLQQRCGLSVIISLRMFAEHGAADRIRGSDAGVHAERHEGIADLSGVFRELLDRVCGVQELDRFA
jgi:hypothetical protein